MWWKFDIIYYYKKYQFPSWVTLTCKFMYFELMLVKILVVYDDSYDLSWSTWPTPTQTLLLIHKTIYPVKYWNYSESTTVPGY